MVDECHVEVVGDKEDVGGTDLDQSTLEAAAQSCLCEGGGCWRVLESRNDVVVQKAGHIFSQWLEHVKFSDLTTCLASEDGPGFRSLWICSPSS